MTKTLLKDVCENIFDCEHKTAPLSDIGFPSIRTPNIGKGRLILDGVNLVSEDTWKLWTKRAVPQHGDLILAREAPAGNIAVVPPKIKLCLGQRTVLIRPDKKKVDSGFLCYYLLSPKMQHELLSKGGGATVAHVNVKDIKNLNLSKLPDLGSQQKISSILSAYDDLIENNQKRIKLLEEIAQRTYEEWFVKFRVNGVQLAIEEETGLPEGWFFQRSDELFNIKIGKTPPREQEEWFTTSADGIKWASIKDINNASVFIHDTSERITEDGVSRFNMNVAKKHTVILSFKLTVGKVTVITENMVTNEAIAHFNVLPDSPFLKSFIYCYLKGFNYNLLGSTSSIGTAINSKIVKAIPFLVPNLDILNQFQRIAEPIFDNIENIQSQNQVLKEARDILLPRLMSGEIDVEEMEVAELETK